jgi:hypothetical protein
MLIVMTLPPTAYQGSPSEFVPGAGRLLASLARHKLLVSAVVVVLTVATTIAWHLAHDTQWIVQPIPSELSQSNLVSLSCAQSGLCVAQIGDNQLIVNDGPNGTWQLSSPVAGAGDKVLASTCVQPSHHVFVEPVSDCIAITQEGVYAPFQGDSFTPNYTPLHFPALPDQSGEYSPEGGMSCSPSGGFCLMLTGLVNTSVLSSPRAITVRSDSEVAAQGLDVWQSVGRVLGTARFHPPTIPSCGANGVCMAIPSRTNGVLPNGFAWRTTDGGARWTTTTSFPGEPLAISCASAADCAVGTFLGTVEFTHDGGRTWSRSGVPGWPKQNCNQFADSCLNPQSVSGLSCWSADACIASTQGYGSSNGGNVPSGGIMETANGGRTWAPLSIPATMVGAVSCAGANNCWAGGSSVVPMQETPVLLRWG